MKVVVVRNKRYLVTGNAFSKERPIIGITKVGKSVWEVKFISSRDVSVLMKIFPLNEAQRVQHQASTTIRRESILVSSSMSLIRLNYNLSLFNSYNRIFTVFLEDEEISGIMEKLREAGYMIIEKIDEGKFIVS